MCAIMQSFFCNKYIDNCLQSIVKQSFDNFEALKSAVKAEVKSLSNQLAPYKRPINIVVRTQNLPRTATNKIKRKEVKELLAECV